MSQTPIQANAAFTGSEASLEAMLGCREARAHLQHKLIQVHHSPLVSFCLNIPGPIKTSPRLRRLFDQGQKEILDTLASNHWEVLELIEQHQNTGDELMLVTQAPAQALKKAMSVIEDTHPLGRLFDIDIIDTHGEKLSRGSYRQCLICARQAQDCARARTHTIREMQDKIQDLLDRLNI